MRWRQIKNPTTNKFEMVPVDAAARAEASVTVRGDIEPFVSPIDGTVVSGRRQYDEHCRKHNVVSAQEFTPEFYAGKAKERADFYEGKRTRQEIHRDRQQIYNTIIGLEKKNGS